MGQAFHIIPVGGTAIAAQQPGPPEQKHSGADGAEAFGTVHGVPKPALQRGQGDVIGSWPAGHQ
ncbi:hypothetical protein D3C79_1083220 [compost metagenome]